VNGDLATVDVRETGWIVRRDGPAGTDPDATHRLDSTWGWHVALVRVEGRWKVDALDSTCLVGCP
jgi:hypothetical protein